MSVKAVRRAGDVRVIAIDLRMVSARPHGIARYAQAIWEGLPAVPGLSYLGLCRRGATLSPVRPTDRLVEARAAFLSPAEQIELPWLLRREGADLFHATSFSVPAAWHGPLVLTLHDVNHLALPGWSGPGRGSYYARLVAPAARRARVLTVSRFAAAEIARWFGLPHDRIRIAPNAVGPQFAPPPEGRVAGVREKLGLPASYLLHVGNGRPHKNAGLLLDLAPSLPLPLVLAGTGFGPAPGIQLLPRVEDDDLPALYAGASIFLFPSRYEGFGLPPLEAAACGTAVLAGAGSALDEIWEGSGALLPPDRPARWREAIAALVAEPARRSALAAACSARAARYRSWTPAVDAALAAYQDVLRPA